MSYERVDLATTQSNDQNFTGTSVSKHNEYVESKEKQEVVKSKEIENKDIESKEIACTVSELYQFATGYDYVYMVLGTIGSILTGFCQPAFCLLFGYALDDLNGASIQTSINQLSLYLFFLGIGNLVFATVQNVCWGVVGERLAQRFREEYVNSVLSQEIGWFDVTGANQLATSLSDLSGQIRDGLTYKTADFQQFAAQIVGCVIVAIALDPYVALIMFACTPLIGGAAAVWVGSIADANKGTSEQYAKAGGLATESLTAIRTVSALNAQPDVITTYRKYLLEAMEMGISRGFRVGLATGFMWFIVLCTYAVTLWYGATQIATTLDTGVTDYPNSQTGGKVYAAFFAALMGAFAFGQIATSLSAFTTARVAAKTFLKVIHRKPLIDGLSQEGLKLEQVTGRVELKDVVFAYPSRPAINVCRGYNLIIEPGQSCALVGASGSGKSTIISLLLRFYDPNAGTVNLDGTDIKTLNTRWLRSKIGYVGQEPVLFSGTIAENIAYGLDEMVVPELAGGDDKSKTSVSELIRTLVIEAAKKSHAHDFIMSLPQGYETDVGTAGSSMSGGQKQRIAIARALVKKPTILLLDEATSALDATSERIVQESIDELQQSKSQTTIVIAHRLSTIKNADKIAVVQEGQIVEEGCHDDLVAKNGVYADLVRLQMDSLADLKPSQSQYLLSAGDGRDEVNADETKDNTAATRSRNSSAAGSKAKSAVKGKSVEEEEEGAPVVTVTLSKEETKKLSSRVWSLIWQHSFWFCVSVLGACMVGGMFQ